MMTAADITLLANPSIGAAFFAPCVDWHERNVGHALMVETLLSGADPGQALLLSVAADLDRGTRDQAAGAMEAVLTCLDTLAAAGRRLAVRDEQERYALAVAVLHETGARRRAILRATPPAHGPEVLELLLEAARAAAPHLQRAAPPAPPPPAPPPPAPVFNLSVQLPPGPLPVQITAQPATRSVQKVERDDALEIIQTITETTPLPAVP